MNVYCVPGRQRHYWSRYLSHGIVTRAPEERGFDGCGGCPANVKRTEAWLLRHPTRQSHLPQQEAGMTVAGSLHSGQVHNSNRKQKLGSPEPGAEASFSPATRKPSALSCLSVGPETLATPREHLGARHDQRSQTGSMPPTCSPGFAM